MSWKQKSLQKLLSFNIFCDTTRVTHTVRTLKLSLELIVNIRLWFEDLAKQIFKNARGKQKHWSDYHLKGFGRVYVCCVYTFRSASPHPNLTPMVQNSPRSFTNGQQAHANNHHLKNHCFHPHQTQRS